MSAIKRKLKPYTLLEKVEIRSKGSGAKKVTWNPIGEIEVAVYKTDSNIQTSTTETNENAYIGLTRHFNLKEGLYMLKDEKTSYRLIKALTEGKYSVLNLSEVTDNV